MKQKRLGSKKPKIRIGDYSIPFDQDGNLIRGGYHYGSVEYKDNYVFEGELKFTGYGKASSGGTYFKFNHDGKTMYMFTTDFSSIVNKMVKGHIKGAFAFTKKGRKYGVKLVG